jgi:hypothetical protein
MSIPDPVAAAEVPEIPTDLVSLSEAARLLPGRNGKSMHRRSIKRMVLGAKLRGWMVGSVIYVSAAEVKALILPYGTPAGMKLHQQLASDAEEARRVQEAPTPANGRGGPRKPAA